MPRTRFVSLRPIVRLEDRVTPTYFGNQLFPLDNPWNQVIAAAPVAANSDAIIARLVARGNPRAKPDFGNPVTDNALYGIPVNIADGTEPRVSIIIPTQGYASESDNVQIPIPANPVIEGDGPFGPGSPVGRGDSHLIVYDKTANVLYETYLTARPNETTYPSYDTNPGPIHPTGSWGAYSVAEWDLNQNSFRPLGRTSADAAGLPILPGLVRPDEAFPVSEGGQGKIDHAIRVTFAQTRGDSVYPASHEASNLTGLDLPRMGERFRLKATFVIPTTWPAEVRAVATAMKEYGLIVADNGSDLYFQGLPSEQWDMDAMLQLRGIRASDFEVVDLAPVVTGLSAATGPSAGGSVITVTGKNFSGASGNLHVFFGSTPAAFTIQSDTSLRVTAPAHEAGTASVRVQSGSTQTDSDGVARFFGYGTSADTNADDFTFTTTSPPPPVGTQSHHGLVGSAQFAVGGAGTASLFNPDGTKRYGVVPFAGFAGEVRVAAGDVNGDGVADLITGTGPGVPTKVRVYDGISQTLLVSLDPFEPSFTGGVFVSAGDLTGDGKADLAITPDRGGGPRVRVLTGDGFTQIADFFGIDDPNFRGGARSNFADMTGDGRADLIVAAGFGGGPRIALYHGASLGSAGGPKIVGDFFLFEETLRNGTYVAGGDLDGDGFADLIAGGGPGGGPRVYAISGKDLTQGTTPAVRANFFAGNPDDRTGVRVAVKDLDGDARADLVVGAGTGSRFRAYRGVNVTPTSVPAELWAFDLTGTNPGVYVG
jgi:hypothetical protein